jgi:DNA-directed RNA polymerase alpha subunit
MVVCGGLHSTEEAFKVERLLAEVFPNAVLRENPNSAPILQPLVRDVKVEDLGLSTLASSSLVRHGIYTLGMLRQKSKAELSAIPGIGRKSINKIQELLEESRRGRRL